MRNGEHEQQITVPLGKVSGCPLLLPVHQKCIKVRGCGARELNEAIRRWLQIPAELMKGSAA